MLTNEKAIKTKDEDFLNRKYFAEHITNAIINYEDKNNESLTIGLYGKWGSGKTSIINMIIEDLESNKDFIIFNFEPWLFSDTNQLLSNFFKEFAQKINHDANESEDMKSIGSKMEAYASFFEPLTLIPEPTIQIIVKAIHTFFSSGGKTFTKMGEAYKKDLSATKKDIEKHLNKLDKKILIIIDDIDRLNNTEIKQIFQLIKSLGNFPNTIYLSSMDKDVIVNALSEVQKGDGNEYLEKIINVPLEIPQLSKTDIDKFLFKKLDEILLEIDEKDFDQSYWGNIFHSGYKNFFLNIRDVIRYINILRFNHDALKLNVNIIDLMAITAFQVFEPKIYAFLKHNKNLLSGQESNNQYSSKQENEKKLKEELENCKILLQKLDGESLISLLQELFIKVKEIHTNTHYVGELSKLRKCSKVASPEFYDAYFSLILINKLSNYEIKNIISKTSNEDDFSNIILSLIKDNRITIFLQRLQDFTREDIPKENFQIVFNVLMNLGDKIPENKEGMFSFGNSTQIMRIFYQLYTQVDDEETRFNLFKQSIENSKDSIYTACLEIITQMQEHGEYENIEEKEDKVITNEHLQELKNILLERINNWLKSNLLFEHNNALSIMYLWKRIREKECIFYINSNINDNENLLKFLKTFIHHSYAQRADDYTERKIRKFNYDVIKDFIDIETIISRVRNINNELDEEENFCIENFISFYENKKQSDEF
ncbi:P-loop NTPase fold protein [Aliarcobacter butzleri]|uniref:KAP family P-loop NTPase fold protein n=1 Tax=Aliarcobacter butzleri TaxID=28197 RepID=UPI00263F13AF|nr:P-loop NTPase fold protein [Aliarcobacter butzleri]MDN5046992.1 P-loop NTPase fold protein [Aliarcobacter butzleri]